MFLVKVEWICKVSFLIFFVETYSLRLLQYIIINLTNTIVIPILTRVVLNEPSFTQRIFCFVIFLFYRSLVLTTRANVVISVVLVCFFTSLMTTDVMEFSFFALCLLCTRFLRLYLIFGSLSSKLCWPIVVRESKIVTLITFF